MKKIKAVPLSIPADGADGALDVTAPAADRRVTGLEKWLAHRVLETLGAPPINIILWDGQEIAGSTSAPVARVRVRDRGAFYKLLINRDLQLGELYSGGRIEIDGNLVRFLEIAYVATTQASRINSLKKYVSRIMNRPRVNTLAGSKSNIHHHYDISNEFYALWLDHEMQYTCAYFPNPGMSLEAAQIAKMDHVCRKLRLKPGDTVVEAGCGWGGLARHMATHYGAQVRAYNISHEQIAYARERAKREGLSERVEYVEDDYRTISGSYDVFVSVGMLEHVGHDHYRELGDVIDRSLTHCGRGLIHSIGRNRPGKLNPWIEKRIFPGAYPPSLREMMEVFEPHQFSVLDVENLRLHYAKTLEHWLARFQEHTDRIDKMFDQDFVRAWRLYLAGSITAFTAASLQLFQVTFARPRDNEIPWNRAHLYGSEH
ncbi:MAG: class I SAM-dependent methyltransferase [Acidiferrobacterales bacterium]